MPARKHAATGMGTEVPVEELSTRQGPRNTWQFASITQYVRRFGEAAVKVEKDFDVEVRPVWH